MYYQVYIDSLFIQEIIINLYVLGLCKLCLMSSATFRRVFFAALFISAYQVIMLYIPFPQNIVLFYGTVFMMYIQGSLITVIIAFGKSGFRTCLKRVFLYMTILMTMGGIFMGIFPRLSLYKRSKVKVLWFLFVGALVYVLLWQILKNKRQSTYFGKLKLIHQGKCLDGKYFMDSGNGLKESISQKAVLIADYAWLFHTFDKDTLMCRPVIYQSVGKQKGILYAYCFDELVIYGETKTYTYDKVWIGVCQEELFHNKDYQVILPLDYGIYYE